MNKNKLTGKIKNIYDEEEIDLNGFYDDKNKKVYLYDKEENKIEIDLIKQNIIRDTNEIKMELNFIEKEMTLCTYLLKDTNNTINLKIYTKAFISDDEHLFISYEILDGDQSFPFELEIC